MIENEDKKVYFILNIKEENPNIKSEKNGNIKFSYSKSLFFKAIGEINLAKLRRERDVSMFTEDSFVLFLKFLGPELDFESKLEQILKNVKVEILKISFFVFNKKLNIKTNGK